MLRRPSPSRGPLSAGRPCRFRAPGTDHVKCMKVEIDFQSVPMCRLHRGFERVEPAALLAEKLPIVSRPALFDLSDSHPSIGIRQRRFAGQSGELAGISQRPGTIRPPRHRPHAVLGQVFHPAVDVRRLQRDWLFSLCRAPLFCAVQAASIHSNRGHEFRPCRLGCAEKLRGGHRHSSGDCCLEEFTSFHDLILVVVKTSVLACWKV